MPSTSATVIVVAPEARAEVHEGLFASAPECVTEIFAVLQAARLMRGSVHPHAIVVDLADGDASWSDLLQSLVANRSSVTAASWLWELPTEQGRPEVQRATWIESPREAVAAIRRSLADSRASWDGLASRAVRFVTDPPAGQRRHGAASC